MRPQPLAACLVLAVLLPLGAAAQAATPAPAVP
ncbi:MAG TPA: cytochrome C, partial [Stenotrophomonas sp.]|nr:cytochrome C [Stenotrophomonas sp.]